MKKRLGIFIKQTMKGIVFTLLLCFTAVQGMTLLAAEQGTEELVKKTQDPLADLISVPFQNNFNFGVG